VRCHGKKDSDMRSENRVIKNIK